MAGHNWRQDVRRLSAYLQQTTSTTTTT